MSQGIILSVVGGGLAGSEAAFQLAVRGHHVLLHEMRGAAGNRGTPAHRTEGLAELVCSNTFKSTDVSNAHGLLKAEMRALGSLILECADAARIPAGTALAVDREIFSAAVQARIEAHRNITIVRDEVTAVPDVGIIATGPLTSDALATAIATRLGEQSLAFYDAIAPVIAAESIDTGIAFRAARWGKETMAEAGEEGAYLNCAMGKEEYDAFIAAMVAADLYHSHEFEDIPYFEGCMPVEEMARRGPETLRHGPMRPVGLRDPRTGRRPWAVLQLRQEDRAGRMWNLVGCQTRMRYPEQTKVFRMVPGLANAEFLRFGSIHRNSYLNAPRALTPHLSLKDSASTLFAGQLTGVEGYTESTATGLLAGINLDRLVRGEAPALPPPTTMLGALYRHLREADPAHFQPMNANFGLLEELTDPPRDKALKRERYAERALQALGSWRQEYGIVPAVQSGAPL
ncbi:MAG: methylenetetrahydrofolate--tRNA-(uracil(54)-C(5))-methyltransferase (FADH(2)-oxidizing) TrmFO [Gemmatimonadaceae bacterium]|nr:methylenetetrahydrofolate--tRNA-(uracil(54)-C(5))-methyltransferase (FADH(2)-oxidizing) TrmFO [Gemmatimonadaceae bacterium]